MRKKLSEFCQHLVLRMADSWRFLVSMRHGRIIGYLLIFVLMGIALSVQLAIAPIGGGLQYLAFFPIIILATIVGGYRAGLFFTVVGLAFSVFIFPSPYYRLSLEVVHPDIRSNLIFLMDGIIVSFSIEAMHRYRLHYALELARSTGAHAELEESTRHFRQILDNLFTYVSLLDENCILLEINKAPLYRGGYRREDVIGRYFYDAPWWTYDAAVRLQLIEACEAARQGQTRRYDVVVKMGSEFVPVDFQISPVRDESGKIIGLLPIAVEISERIKAEQALRESENKFHVLFDSVNDCVMILDLGGRIKDINRTGHARLGYAKEEMLGKYISQFDTPEFASGAAGRVAMVHEKGFGVFESAHVRKDGSVMPIEVSARMVELEGQQLVLSAVRDISERKLAEAALRKSEANLRCMMDNLPYLAWLKDAEGRYIAINKAFSDYLRLEDSLQAVGKTDLDLQPKDLAEKYRADDAEVMALRQQKHIEESAFDGNALHYVETFKTPIMDARGNVLGTVGFAKNITERKRIEAELRIAAIAFETHEAMVITDANTVILRVNQAFTRITGYTAEELVGQTPSMLQSGRHDADFYRKMWESIKRTDGWNGEIWDRRKNGEVYPKLLTITAVRDSTGAVTHYIGTHQDITERKDAEERIAELAFFDQLTGLPNRTLLLDRLKHAMLASSRSGSFGALLFIDLDNFKMLNDTLGHDMGDLLLKQVANRLQLGVREGDTVARLGGDEFVVILEGLSKDKEEAAAHVEIVGEKLQAALKQPYLLGNINHHSTASIGVTLFMDDLASRDDLMKQADLAMYMSKEVGRNLLRFFEPSLEAAVQERAAMEADLRLAIDEQQFLLHYQPQVTSEGQLTGAEALVRWQHPQRGMVAPDEFIPLAEKSGIILSLGDWVLRTACIQLVAWAAKPEMAHLTLAVNVSACEFRQPNFVGRVLTALNVTGANPQRLKLELTESLLVENVQDVIEKMAALKAQGVGFSLDDFGTGYSSLSYLKRMPLDQLKIDMSFIRDVLTDPNDASIVKTIIALAMSLGLNVIAEGVETEAQLDFLAGVGCHAYQGYFFSKPLPIHDFELLYSKITLF
jgi:diguanylate cyclase (GGDEF)-like protein/PAS domain S-box-containing protein